MNKSILISEKQFNTIHKNLTQKNNSVVISDWLSPDEEYVIFLDELYDLKNKKFLGDVWENFDNMKLFLKHSFTVASNIPRNIRESSLKGLKKMVINESTKDYSFLKPYVKQMILEQKMNSKLNEDLFDKAKEWGSDAWEGVKNFGSDLWQGTKDFGSAVSKGDYKEALKIIGKGVLYLARKIRSALHSPVGLILDTILIVSGIGKAIQWIPWAIVVALDIYELSTGDYEDKSQSQWMRILLFSCDVLGLVISGLVATGGMKYILRNGLKYGTMASFLRGTKKDPEGQKYLLQMEGAYSDNSYLVRMDQAEGYVTPRNPKIGGFIGEQRENGSILGKLFGQEVQKPALAMSNTKKIEKPSFTSKIMSNFI
jgi:hypothetical protein